MYSGVNIVIVSRRPRSECVFLYLVWWEYCGQMPWWTVLASSVPSPLVSSFFCLGERGMKFRMSFLLCPSLSCTDLYVQYFSGFEAQAQDLTPLGSWGSIAPASSYLYMAGPLIPCASLFSVLFCSFFVCFFLISSSVYMCAHMGACPCHAIHVLYLSPADQAHVPGLLGAQLSLKSHLMDPCWYLRHGTWDPSASDFQVLGL